MDNQVHNAIVSFIYAICKADMLLKGDGEQAEHIAYGSTLSADGNASRQFDFMLANPPYGKSWKADAEKMGGKKDILDSRFNAYLEDGTQLTCNCPLTNGKKIICKHIVAVSLCLDESEAERFKTEKTVYASEEEERRAKKYDKYMGFAKTMSPRELREAYVELMIELDEYRLKEKYGK